MMEVINQLLGFTDNNAVRAILVLAAVILLIIILGFFMRRITRRGAGHKRGRVTRLAVIEAIAVDQRRRLVLVRRDNTEHLVMIGGASDTVIEQGIQRIARPIGGQRSPADRVDPRATARQRPTNEAKPAATPPTAQPAAASPAVPVAAAAAPVAAAPVEVAPVSVQQSPPPASQHATPSAPAPIARASVAPSPPRIAPAPTLQSPPVVKTAPAAPTVNLSAASATPVVTAKTPPASAPPASAPPMSAPSAAIKPVAVAAATSPAPPVVTKPEPKPATPSAQVSSNQVTSKQEAEPAPEPPKPTIPSKPETPGMAAEKPETENTEPAAPEVSAKQQQLAEMERQLENALRGSVIGEPAQNAPEASDADLETASNKSPEGRTDQGAGVNDGQNSATEKTGN